MTPSLMADAIALFWIASLPELKRSRFKNGLTRHDTREGRRGVLITQFLVEGDCAEFLYLCSDATSNCFSLLNERGSADRV